MKGRLQLQLKSVRFIFHIHTFLVNQTGIGMSVVVVLYIQCSNHDTTYKQRIIKTFSQGRVFQISTQRLQYLDEEITKISMVLGTNAGLEQLSRLCRGVICLAAINLKHGALEGFNNFSVLNTSSHLHITSRKRYNLKRFVVEPDQVLFELCKQSQRQRSSNYNKNTG